MEFWNLKVALLQKKEHSPEYKFYPSDKNFHVIFVIWVYCKCLYPWLIKFFPQSLIFCNYYWWLIDLPMLGYAKMYLCLKLFCVFKYSKIGFPYLSVWFDCFKLHHFNFYKYEFNKKITGVKSQIFVTDLNFTIYLSIFFL